jgi:putative protein-disulfide isomerase
LDQISQHPAGHEVKITVYTDPLCCWTWAMQPALIELKKELGNKARWEHKMGGLISSWFNFHDELNSISRPAQMGPLWMHAGHVANRPIHHQLWVNDPPASSYPACVAVKSVQLQAPEYGEIYLQLLMDACMGEGRNIARQSILFEIAEKFALDVPHFNIRKFEHDYKGNNGTEAFRSDLGEVHTYNINRFPTLIIRSGNERAISLSGYHNFTRLMEVIETLVPGIGVER